MLLFFSCLLRLQPLTGKVTSVTQLEKGAHSEAMEEEEEGEGGKEAGSEEKADYAGGRFAGVGEFAPALTKAAKKKVSLPLLTSKPEAVLR